VLRERPHDALHIGRGLAAFGMNDDRWKCTVATRPSAPNVNQERINDNVVRPRIDPSGLMIGVDEIVVGKVGAGGERTAQ